MRANTQTAESVQPSEKELTEAGIMGLIISAAGAAGMGLSNMADRARGLGGSINISSDEKGFRIFAAVPKNSSMKRRS